MLLLRWVGVDAPPALDGVAGTSATRVTFCHSVCTLRTFRSSESPRHGCQYCVSVLVEVRDRIHGPSPLLWSRRVNGYLNEARGEEARSRRQRNVYEITATVQRTFRYRSRLPTSSAFQRLAKVYDFRIQGSAREPAGPCKATLRVDLCQVRLPRCSNALGRTRR